MTWSERYKPAASRRTHLTAAGLMWTLVGLGLSSAGFVWIFRSRNHWTWLVITLAIVLGSAKGVAVLRRAARRNAARIETRGDGRCLGGFLGLGSWLLVAGMMTVGRILRASSLPREWLGAIYLGVGVALVVGSIELWRARRRV